MNPGTPGPSLTLVVVQSAPGPLGSAFFSSLERDLADGLLEVIVVADVEPAAMAGARKGARWVASCAGATVPDRRGLGLAAARTPFVALTESFCVPAPGWTRAILRAHAERDVVAVGGPVDRRAGVPRDWALTLLEYGRFFGAGQAGEVSDLPGINVAYRVERLVRVLGRLPARVVEVEVHSALREAGETLWRDPGAVMLDAGRMASGAARRAQYRHGRFYGGRRVAGRPAAHRLLRLALAPAVPVVLGSRIARRALGAGRGGAFVRSLPHLAVLLAAWAVGEAAGSLFGEGRTGEQWT